MHILFKSKKKKWIVPSGHAYSVSDWGVRTEREREREREREPWHKIANAQGHLSQKKHDKINQGATQHEEQPGERDRERQREREREY